ncbi:MAG: hypothetical protein R3325_09395 [Thermoanaerobaculia bacterium]|nr:hypothetical protein [Thermoanaerobaculia bacterium]
MGALWGIGGVLLLLSSAVWRLTPVGLAALEAPLGAGHTLFLVLWMVFMLWSEGYRGFHLGFAPRVVARARYLREHPRPLHVALAPLYCMGFVHATARRRVTSLAVTAGIVALVVLVRRFPQPWRGLVDLGVVVGLAAGILSLAWYAARGFGPRPLPVSPEVPGGGSGAAAG